jgi:exosortase/archaeosortase family protein
MLQALEQRARASVQALLANIHHVVKLIPFVSFGIAFVILYCVHPGSFEPTWTGSWERRINLVFFLWLGLLETILNWEVLDEERRRIGKVRTVALSVVLWLPILYVVVANYGGLNGVIVDVARQQGILADWAALMPLAVEYLVFAVFFALILFFARGRDGVECYSISLSFLLIIGVIYLINNQFPFGKFTPFQILVHPTTVLAASVLNGLGFTTTIGVIDNHPVLGTLTQLSAADAQGGSATFGIAWPCAGVESLLIYAVTIALFLKNSGMPLKQKAVFFVFGALVTYFINIFRIVTIFVLAIGGGDVGLFHDYYGQLYSIIWIISYPLIIVGARTFWQKVVRGKLRREHV